MTVMPELKSALCNSCGLCVVACHAGGFVTREPNNIMIRPTEKCDYCGVCEAVCPTGAINCNYSISFPPSNQTFH